MHRSSWMDANGFLADIVIVVAKTRGAGADRAVR